MVEQARTKRKTNIFNLEGNVYAFDSTTIDLCLEVFWWATWDEEHLFEMKQSDFLYQTYQHLIAECDSKINEIATRYAAIVDIPKAELLYGEKYNTKKNRIHFYVEKVAFELWGVNVMRMPGMSRGSLLRLLGELGH